MPIAPPTDPDVDWEYTAEQGVHQLYEIRALLKELKVVESQINTFLRERLRAGDIVVFVDDAGDKHTGKLVIPEVSTVNLALLRELVGDEIFDRVTTTRIAMAEFNRAVEDGTIPLHVAASVVTYSEGTPSVRF